MKRKFKSIALAIMLLFSTSVFAQSWTIYDGSVLPGEAGWNVKGSTATMTIVDDTENAGNKFFQFTSGITDKNTIEGPKFDSKVSGGGAVQTFTVVMRARAIMNGEEAYSNFMEVELKDGEYRDKVRFYTDGLDIEKANNKAKAYFPEGTDAYDFNIYTITFDERKAKVWINDELVDESTAPSVEVSNADSRFVIGDSNGSSDYGAEYDWIIWDNSGAYAPGEGATIPEELLAPEFDPGSATSINTASTELKLNPNPVSDILTITSSSEILNVQIYSLTGANVKSYNGNYSTVNVSDLNNGVYLISVTTTEGTVIEKLIIQ